jgi:hypothetical protein
LAQRADLYQSRNAAGCLGGNAKMDLNDLAWATGAWIAMLVLPAVVMFVIL